MSHLPDICVIVPVYNERKRLVIDSFRSFIANYPNVYLIFVNDASRDGSEELLGEIKQFDPARIEIIHHDTRLGKAEAIRSGMLSGIVAARFSYFAFIDADLAVPFEDILLIVEQLDLCGKTMAFGVRDSSHGSSIKRTAIRKFMATLFKVYLHRVLKFKIADSQCGVKVFQAKIVSALYTDPFETHWLSDVELLLRYCIRFQVHRGEIQNHLLQIPVSRYEDKPGSKATILELTRMVKEMIVVAALSISRK